MSKKYGLIKPDKSKPTFKASRNVFGDGSESEDDTSKKTFRPSQKSSKMAALTQEKALEEDPSVYQYDEIYDSMAKKKADEKAKTKVDTKPKYIETLLKTAQKRKIENERRIERQVQKEREKEGNEFADKEVFVTSAYKKKLQEMREEEENEKREEYLESIGDVTKQRDLGGFYRHLYEQRMGVENKNDAPSPEKKTKRNEKRESVEKDSKKSNKRNYRKRMENKSDSSDSENQEDNKNTYDKLESAKKTRYDANIDADSDFSIDDSSSEEENEETNKGNSKTREDVKTPEIPKTDADNPKSDKQKKSDSKDKKEGKAHIEQPKVDIWKKRTVGVVFDEALRRYYERKAAKA